MTPLESGKKFELWIVFHKDVIDIPIAFFEKLPIEIDCGVLKYTQYWIPSWLKLSFTTRQHRRRLVNLSSNRVGA